jgi:hypothetical protein
MLLARADNVIEEAFIALQISNHPDVRFGSIASVRVSWPYVRSYPDSDQNSDLRARRLSASMAMAQIKRCPARLRASEPKQQAPKSFGNQRFGNHRRQITDQARIIRRPSTDTARDTSLQPLCPVPQPRVGVPMHAAWPLRERGSQ